MPSDREELPDREPLPDREVLPDREQRLRKLIELWNAGEREFAMLPEYVDPAIELESPFASVSGEPYRGHAGIERWVRDVDEQFAEWSLALEHMRADGDRVIATVTVGARGRGSDVSLRFPAATVCDFGPDGRITRMRLYLDVQEALKAAGLDA